MPVRHHALLSALLVLAAAPALRADDALGTCESRNAMLEKRLALLQLRLVKLEHEVAANTQPEPTSEAWRDASAWQRLRRGMTQADVLRILGRPGKVTTYYGFQRWEYPDALGKRVNFDEQGVLVAWSGWAR